jgi:hypothetical protein
MSRLRAVKAEEAQKRLKVFFYGAAKIGKTTAAIQFPKPYWIDTEGCADKPIYVDLLNKSGGVVFQTQDFDEVLEEVRALLTEKHEFKTLIIDSFTILYNDLVDKEGLKHGTEFGRHYNEANKKVKRLLNMLLRLDMNVLITSHCKTEYGQNLAVIGQTFDCYKKLDYLFDVIFEVQKRGKERVALVKGSRFECYKENDSFPFNYEEISSRYGKEVIEKDSVPVKLAEFAQVMELMKLIELVNFPEEGIAKLKKKANVESFEEMSYEDIQKCINFLKDKIKGEIA